MTRLMRLFARDLPVTDVEVIGEDMSPSPLTLAEHSAAIGESPSTAKASISSRPFETVAEAPIHDFRGG